MIVSFSSTLIEFPVGGAPQNPASSLVKPEPTLDVSNHLVRGNYERNLSPRLFWNAGGSWYRNDDAGILNRYIAFAGLGNNWVDNQRRRFATTYGVSYTDREEEEPDPEKDRRFAGARVGWDYTEHFNAGTTFNSDLATNVNFADPSDYSISTINALTVSVTNRHGRRTFPHRHIWRHKARARLLRCAKDKLDTIVRTALVIKFQVMTPAVCQ